MPTMMIDSTALPIVRSAGSRPASNQIAAVMSMPLPLVSRVSSHWPAAVTSPAARSKATWRTGLAFLAASSSAEGSLVPHASAWTALNNSVRRAAPRPAPSPVRATAIQKRGAAGSRSDVGAPAPASGRATSVAADLDPFSSSGLRDQGSGWIRARPSKRLAREAALRKGDRAINLRVLRPSIKRKPHELRRLAPRRAPVSEAPKPVAIIMGSQSDWAVMRRAAETLEALGVGYEALIVSAHRTPDRLVAFAKGAKPAGFKVVIAGAGGAAHLPGMTAAFTTLPVFGVPVPSKALSGQDSLLSIVQMPAGVPVGTLAIGEAGAVNAALLACAVLALADEALSRRLEAWRAERTAEVAERPSDEAKGR